MAKTEKTLSALKQEMDDRFGSFYTDERSFRFTPEGKRKLEEEIFDRMHLPVFPCNERKLSWEDGCKVYFDTGWLLIRFQEQNRCSGCSVRCRTKYRRSG